MHPALVTELARRKVREYWRRSGRPCAVCGAAIDYAGPRYLVVNGRRVQNPRALVVGHIVSRRKAKLLGWSAEQINALSNTRPECQRCSNLSGARDGQRAQAAAGKGRRATYVSRW
jgi:hypothetical protein